MVRYTKRMSVCVLTATLAFSTMGMTVNASNESILPGGGVSLALANGNKLEEVTNDVPTMPIESIIEWFQVEDNVEAEPTEEDLFRNLVIAQVTNYVNVRSIPSEEGEILGKLYNNSVGTFISEENGWYQINFRFCDRLCKGRVLCHRVRKLWRLRREWESGSLR